MMNSRDGQEAAAMEPEGVPAPVTAKKLWRMVRAAYLVVGKGIGKHQPKLSALGDHLNHLLSKRPHHGGLVAAAREHRALAYLTSALSCRSIDAAATVVHPYPWGSRGRAPLSSLSCRSSVDAYRPREVEFSCRSRRQRARDRLAGGHPQQHGFTEHCFSDSETASRLFELMDVREASTDNVDHDVARELEIAPRQVRITDSPFLAREEVEVDRRADEFITWFHEQLRMQQQRPAAVAQAQRVADQQIDREHV